VTVVQGGGEQLSSLVGSKADAVRIERGLQFV
jgi:hypothetical protein